MGVTRRKLLAGGGTTVVGGATIYKLTTCGSDISDVDHEGSQATVTGELSSRMRGGSSALLRGDNALARVRMQARYQNHIEETETGDCITVSGLVTEVVNNDDGSKTVRLESGEVE